MSEQGMKIHVERKLLPGLTMVSLHFYTDGDVDGKAGKLSRPSYIWKSCHEVNEINESQAPATRTLNRERRRPGWHSDYVMKSNASMQEEIEALHKNKTWELVPLVRGRKPIVNKWVYKIKKNGDDQVESKSTTGYVFALWGGTVSWVSKLQSVVAMSTTEAEYVAVAQASKEAVWLKMLLEELGYEQEKITLFCDNQSALYLARNPAFWQPCNRRFQATRPYTLENKANRVKNRSDYCCSDGSLGDKIIYDLDKTPDLCQRPPQNCPKCGNPVDGHCCQGCALLRKKLKEDLFTYCIKNRILQDSFEPSNDNTNVVNALQEPFVVKQDPGKTSSQSPPQINHYCCYGCGDPLKDIFCHQCTCELCGRGAHYGYNCPPKVPVVLDLEPFNNQTVDELSQTLPSFDPTCYSEDGNSFTYDSTSNLVHDSLNVFDPPLQPQHIYMSFVGTMLIMVKIVHFKFRSPMIRNCYFVVPQHPQKEMSVEFLQEKRNQINSVKTFLRKFNRISFYEMPKVLSLAWETIVEIELAFEDKHCQPEDILELFQRLHNDEQNIHEELAAYINTPNWDRPTICYDDDDDDYAIAVTPSLSTEEPDNSLSMRDEHLDTVSVTESDEFIKSSVESLVPIPSESEGIPDNMCDVPFHDNSSPLDVSKEKFEDFSDSNDESTSYDDDSFSIDNIEYVEVSPPNSEIASSEVMEIVIPEIGGIEDDILLTIKDDILREILLSVNLLIDNIEALNDNPTSSFDFMTKSSSTSLNSLLEETNTFDNSLPELETFCFDLEEINKISSDSTTTQSDSSFYDSFVFDLLINPFPPADRSDFYEFADELAHIISPPEYDCFCFKNEPNSRDFTMDVVEDIFPTKEPRVHNAFPTHPTLQLNLDFILSSESLFAYVVWIFLSFFSLVFSCSSISSILRE
nr:retrovirus-related Pol polyprotein from transposon TNT 1-94 [Tanacetum cinerariifolium]